MPFLTAAQLESWSISHGRIMNLSSEIVIKLVRLKEVAANEDCYISLQHVRQMSLIFSLSQKSRYTTMNRFVDLVAGLMTDKDRRAKAKSSRLGQRKHDRGPKVKKRSTGHQQSHFFDPNAPNEADSSSDHSGFSELASRETDAWTRIEIAEADLAKERKRIEQLEQRRREAEESKERRRIEREEDADLAPRERNRKAYERAVARVEKKALRKIEELDRRFAHSDKQFEMKLAREEMETDERRDKGAEEHQDGGASS